MGSLRNLRIREETFKAGSYEILKASRLKAERFVVIKTLICRKKLLQMLFYLIHFLKSFKAMNYSLISYKV